MKICYVSLYANDEGCGASQVSKSNLELLISSFGEESVEHISLAGNRLPSDIINKVATFFFSLFGYSSCLSYFSMRAFLKCKAFKDSNVIWLDGSLYGPLVSKIKKNHSDKKVVTFMHNVEYDFYKSVYSPKGYLYKVFTWFSYFIEKKSIIDSAIIISLTYEDAARVESLYGKKVNYVIPVLFENSTGLDLINRKTKESSICENKMYKALFVGSDFPPNVEAVDFICREVMPYVNHDISLTIIGKGMDKYRSKYQDKNITIHGFVQDLSAFYEECDIVLSPIFSGAGMKVKVAEAFKHSKGVLGTKFGFYGYEIESDFIFIAESATDYIDFLNDHDERLKYEGEKAFSYFKENLTIDSKVDFIRKIINR